ncbi:hypothetical protein D9M68_938680 [compost metagenome]
MGAVVYVGLQIVEPQHHRALAAGHWHAPVAHRHAVGNQIDADPGIAHQLERIDPLAAKITKGRNRDRHANPPEIGSKL